MVTTHCSVTLLILMGLIVVYWGSQVGRFNGCRLATQMLDSYEFQ